jgi:outer membrane protein
MKMKKYFLIVLVALFSVGATAQKFAYVDTDYILSKIPEFNDAQAQLDDMVGKWQKEVESKISEIDKMYKEYQANRVIYPEEMRQKKENEIIEKETKLKEFQNSKFGEEGELFKKRKELIEPIQERVYNAIQDVARDQKLAIIFDKAGTTTVIYSDIKYNVSDDVLENLGYAY